MASSTRFTTTDAAIQANTEAAFTLLKTGITDPELMAPLLQQIEQGQLDFRAQDSGGCSLLLWALLENNVSIAEALLKAGSDVHQKSDFGTSALHAAIIKKCDLHILQLLLAAGAEIEAWDKDGRTHLHLAAEKGHGGAVPLLLAVGANIEVRDRMGNTPLHLAITNRHPEVLQALLAAGADIEARDKEGNTPLHLAVSHGHAKAVQALLAAGADVEARNKDGRTPLRLAARSGHAQALQALLAAGASVHSISKEDKTASAKVTKMVEPILVTHINHWQSRYKAFLAGNFHPKTQADWLGLASIMPLHDPQAHNPVHLRLRWLEEYYRQPALRELHKQANITAAQGWRA